MKYNVVHITRYFYTETATLCHNQAHLTPRETAWQTPISNKLDITPEPGVVQSWTDAFGNRATYFSIEQSHRELNVVAKCQVEVQNRSNVTEREDLGWEDAVRQIENPMIDAQYDATVFMCRTMQADRVEAVREYGRKSFPAGRPLFEGVLELTERIHADFQFDPTATNISTPAAEILIASPRCLPGFRPLANCVLAVAWAGGALCERIFSNSTAAGKAEVGRRRRHACLGVCVFSRLGMG